MTENQSKSGEEQTPFRKLHRSIHQKVLGGVCGGLAEYFNIDVVIIRVLWVLFSLMGGAGLLAYMICWIIIPQRIDQDVTFPSRGPGIGLVLGIILVTLGIILFWTTVGNYSCYFPFAISHFAFPGIFVVIGLGILIGWVLSRSGQHVPAPDPKETESEVKPTEAASKKQTTRLYRSRTMRVISGLCGGLGNYFNLDPTIVRILWVLFAFASFGTALLVYIILIFVVPEEPII
jgi:phage shock protein C